MLMTNLNHYQKAATYLGMAIRSLRARQAELVAMQAEPDDEEILGIMAASSKIAELADMLCPTGDAWPRKPGATITDLQTWRMKR